MLGNKKDDIYYNHVCDNKDNIDYNNKNVNINDNNKNVNINDNNNDLNKNEVDNKD